jgi:hypothetical protein
MASRIPAKVSTPGFRYGSLATASDPPVNISGGPD